MPAITLATFESLIWSRLENDTAFYPSGEVDDATNEALRIAAAFKGFAQTRQSAGNTVANQVLYSVPSPILYPTDVFWAGTELFKSPANATAQQFAAWLGGLPGNGPPAYWVPLGIKLFAIVPADPNGGNLLEVAGVAEQAQLVNSGDTAVLPDQFADVVVEHAVIALQLAEGGKVFADATQRYKVLAAKLKELGDWIMAGMPRYGFNVLERK